MSKTTKPLGAVTGKSDAKPTTTRQVRARASMKVRIALIVLAVVLALGAGVGAVNWYALGTGNAAVSSLNASIRAYNADSPDLEALQISQQQTDAQFDAAQASSWLQLPQVRHEIDANAEVSRQLTLQIAKDLKATQDQQDPQAANVDKKSKSNNQQSDQQSSDSAKLNQLLQQNKQQHVSPSDAPTSSTGGTSGDKNVKPW